MTPDPLAPLLDRLDRWLAIYPYATGANELITASRLALQRAAEEITQLEDQLGRAIEDDLFNANRRCREAESHVAALTAQLAQATQEQDRLLALALAQQGRADAADGQVDQLSGDVKAIQHDYHNAHQAEGALTAQIQALRPYGQHMKDCRQHPSILWSSRPDVCTCGLAALLGATPAQTGEP